MIRLENISKIYQVHNREVRALDDVSVTIEAGEFVSIQGPSGCGKSTLMMTVAGLSRPSAGRLMFGEEDLYALPSAKRAALRAEKVGFVFQMFHLIPYLSVWENVMSPRLAGARVARTEVDEIIERVGLTERIHHYPAELSTGERQRVALARAFLNRPQVILADEPTGNLDPANQTEVLDFLAEFNQEGGTVLLVTHEAHAASYASRALHLDHGVLQPE